MNTTSSSPTYERLSSEKKTLEENLKQMKKERDELNNDTDIKLRQNGLDYLNNHIEKRGVYIGIYSVEIVVGILVAIMGVLEGAYDPGMQVFALGGIILTFAGIYQIYKELQTPKIKESSEKALEQAIADKPKKLAELDSQINTLRMRLKNIPSLTACRHYERNLEIAKLSGISKREKMQADWQVSCIEAQRALKLSIESQAKTAGSMIGYKEQSNWAVMGGIASGIAGPVAGIANAMSIQAEERTRAEQIRKGGERVVASMVHDLETLQSVEKDLNRVNEVISRTASLSVISDISADEIQKHISCNLKIANPNCQLLEISGNVVWTKQLPALRSHKKPVRIDGTLQVDVKKDNEIVSTAYIPLPLEGIPYDKNVSVIPVTGYCLLPQASLTGPFSISLSKKQNLWILEG